MTALDYWGVLGAACAVFALYLGLQVLYLFGNAGAAPGSHVPYAEAVHRGCIELNVAASLAALLIMLLLGRPREPGVARGIRLAAVALIVECALLTASAFHRVTYHEEAYRYTIRRLLVQVYAIAALLGLGLLVLEVRGAPLAACLRMSAARPDARVTAFTWYEWSVRRARARRVLAQLAASCARPSATAPSRARRSVPHLSTNELNW